MSEQDIGVSVVISVPEETPPVSVRIMRGDRLIHEFVEPETSAQLASQAEESSAKPVAWLYEMLDHRDLSFDRCPKRISWTETPLYAGRPDSPANREPQSIESAPKDGTMVWLLVDYADGGAPLADATRAWTIGFNNLGNTEEDRWIFAGWSWSQDCFCEGSGTPVAWKPLGFDLEADDA